MEQNMNNNNNMSQDNKEALLRELNKKAKTGNILRGIGIGVLGSIRSMKKYLKHHNAVY